MKTTIKTIFLALTLAALSSGAWASHPFEGRCFNEPKSLEYWVNASETILVGEVEEVTYYPPFESSGAACWLRFRSQEWLKGNGSEEIWIRVSISLRKVTEKTHDDMISLKYCEFKENNFYIIYGRHIHKQVSLMPPEWISIASDLGSTWFCPPHQKLRPFEMEIDKIRRIVKKDKEK